MPKSRSTHVSRAVLVLAGLVSESVLAASSSPAWFGEPCETLQAFAAGEQKLLVLIRDDATRAGEEWLLQAAAGRLWADRAFFVAWNLPLPLETRGEWYPLDAVPGLIYRHDHCTEEVWLDHSQVSRAPHRVSVDGPAPPPASKIAESGGFLNFDGQVLDVEGNRQYAGQAELGVFAGPGFALSSAVNDGIRTVRLENSVTLDYPARRERFRLGDSISRSHALGSSVRFGGIQWGTDFSLQPDLVTFPLPSVTGTARLPSAAEIYVNQSLRASEDVPAGPFELTDLPVVSGAGDLQMVLRDALGRSQVVSYPFYASPSLLREGLSDYSVQAGWLRESFGLLSADYADAFAAGTWRHGLNSSLTAELRGDVADGQQAVGGALSGALPSFGAWTAGASASRSEHGWGALGVLAHEYLSPGWHYGVEARIGSRDFAQPGQPIGDLLRSFTAHAGIGLRGNGSLSAFYLGQLRRGEEELRLLGLNYGLSLARSWQANASVTHSFGERNEQTALLTLNYQWDERSAVTFQQDQTRRDEDEYATSRASWQRSAVGPVGLGYRLYAEEGLVPRNGASLRWGTERGIVTGEMEQADQAQAMRLGFATGIAALGSDVFWTRPVASSFAVIDTGTIPNVRVYAENRLVGRTDQNGVLLVPELRSFESNQLSIDESDIPIAFDLASLSAQVRPPARSGVRVTLAPTSPASFLVRTRLADGAAPPAGARVELNGVAMPLPLGYGGAAYLTAAPGPYQLTLRWADRACRATLTLADFATDLNPAPVLCRTLAP